MDRINFTSSINYANSTQEKVVSNHFDKLMTLYDIIQPSDSLILAKENVDLEFTIIPRSNEDANRIMMRLENKHITNYGVVYKINSMISGENILVELIEKA